MTEKDIFIERMRTIWHVTSFANAENILTNKAFVTEKPEKVANFHPNQSSLNQLDVPQEVSLGFYWHGNVAIKPIYSDKPIACNTLTVNVTDGYEDCSIEKTKVWSSQVQKTNGEVLEFCDIAMFFEFKDLLTDNHGLYERYQRLKKVSAEKIFIQVI